MSETLIVVPAYNEAGRIGAVVAAIQRWAPGCDILVVDDGSTDGTAAVARAAGATVVSLPFNLGYGAALQTGYKYALRQEYQFVVQLDGDGQHEPACIGELLDVVRQGWADVVIGSRFLGRGTYHAPVARRLGMRIFGGLASLLIGQPVSDPTSGFQALCRRAVAYEASDVYPADFPDADVIVMLHFAGFRIKEVPVVMYPRASGKSMHAGLKPLYYIFKMVLSMGMTLLRERRVYREVSA
ncbi:MAG: glycosyltransferase family 2 protein [Chloroflexi bacterium]|nr:glycosyltransferase family 2 protein [Chloroflexota bacterium]